MRGRSYGSPLTRSTRRDAERTSLGHNTVLIRDAWKGMTRPRVQNDASVAQERAVDVRYFQFFVDLEGRNRKRSFSAGLGLSAFPHFKRIDQLNTRPGLIGRSHREPETSWLAGGKLVSLYIKTSTNMRHNDPAPGANESSDLSGLSTARLTGMRHKMLPRDHCSNRFNRDSNRCPGRQNSAQNQDLLLPGIDENQKQL